MKLINVETQPHSDCSGRTEYYIDDETGNLYSKTYLYNYDDYENQITETKLHFIKKLKYSELYEKLRDYDRVLIRRK